MFPAFPSKWPWRRKPDVPTAAMPIPRETLESLCDSDRFIVSYPRSGNTWLRHLLQEIIVATHPDLPQPQGLEAIQPTVHRGVIDQSAGGGFLPWRLLKSHNIQDIRGHYMVYLFRLPTDAIVSYYHFALSREGADKVLGFDAFCTVSASRWCEHIALGLEQQAEYPDRTLFVSYERLMEDTGRQLRRVTDFLELNATDAQITVAVEACEFERLRERECARNPKCRERGFFRKGRIGGGAEELKPELRNTVEKLAMPYYERSLKVA
jgi:hypothetical protein